MKLYTTSEFISSVISFENNLTTINHFQLIHIPNAIEFV